jgi:heterodisulfide reductase subunit A
MAKDKMTGAVMVVGGGIGGMQASLDLAEAGFKVYLMDKSPSIGGVMARLDKTLPTNDCSMCILSPKMVEIDNHPNVELVTYSELKSVEGEAGNFQATITKKSRLVDEIKCTGCGACAEACIGTKTPDEFQAGMEKRRAVYLPFPQAVPKLALIDKDACLLLAKGKCDKKCVEACQVGAIDFELKDVDVKIHVGAIILATGLNPYDPAGLAPYHYDHPDVISAMEMERLQCASGPTGGQIKKPSDGENPKNIAWLQCVGSRSVKEGQLPYCSGVCCAHSVKEAMIVKDHEPDIDCHIFFHEQRSFGKGYEAFFRRAEDEYGIKFHRFREPMVQADDDGIVIKADDGQGLQEMAFDMAVLTTGFQPPTGMEPFQKLGVGLNRYGFLDSKPFDPLDTGVPGVYACGAFTGPRDIPETVAQASGAASAAMALLADARGSMVVEKKYPPEKDIGAEPRIGVFVCHCGTNIGGVVDVPSVRDYAKELPGVVYAEDNLYTCSAEGCEKIKQAIAEHDLSRVVVAACTPRTHEPLFRETCREAGLNRYLFEMANIRDHCSWVHRDKAQATAKARDLVRMAVSKAGLLQPLPTYEIPVKQSALVIGGGLSGLTAALDLADQGFEVDIVEREKALGGHLINHHSTLSGENPHEKVAELVSKVGSNARIKIHTGAELESVSGYVGNFTAVVKGNGQAIESGAIIVATGGVEGNPGGFFYGKDSRVMTQGEFEARLFDKGLPENTVVMIQCAGSRSEERPYCSRVCCGLALKNALNAREKNPGAHIVVLYRDIMAYGFKEDYYRKAREQGIRFLRYDGDNPPEVKAGENGMIVSVKPAELDTGIDFETDLVVLSAPVDPSPGARGLSEMLKVPVDANGFFSEAHVKLRPVDFASDGIFVCGLAHGPKAIAENVAQAKGAAARAATILARGVFTSEGAVARVDEEACRGCGTCVQVCPFSAISLKKVGEALVAEVNAALCKCCGTCSAACLSSAITTQHFTNDEIFAMIAAEMEE